MNTKKSIVSHLAGIAVLVGLILPSIMKAQTDEDVASPIRLESYNIVIMELKKPIIRKDLEGNEQKYNRAYLVTLKGNFPRDRALAMELFIGDYEVPEYGGTKEGLYFKIYDPRLVQRLEEKEFRYRFESDEIKSFDIKFSLKEFQPLKIKKEK